MRRTRPRMMCTCALLKVDAVSTGRQGERKLCQSHYSFNVARMNILESKQCFLTNSWAEMYDKDWALDLTIPEAVHQANRRLQTKKTLETRISKLNSTEWFILSMWFKGNQYFVPQRKVSVCSCSFISINLYR